MSSNSESTREHTFNWKIKDINLCTKKKGEYFESPVFRAESLYDTSWQIRLHPRGDLISEEGYMRCWLVRCKTDNLDSKINCEFEISVMSSEGATLHSQKTTYNFPKSGGWGWINFWKKSLQSIETSDFLLIRCNLKSNEQKNLLRSETTGVTCFDSDKFSLKWIVKNLNSGCSEVRKFPHTGTSQIEISLEVPDDDIKITIRKVDGATERKSVMCHITLLDAKGGKQDSRHALHLFETSIEKASWEFPTFLKKSDLNSEKEKYLKDDCFTLECKITISDGKQTNSVEEKKCDSSAVDVSDVDITTVLEDYKKLCRGKIHTDAKLLVEGQVIEAHKAILCIRSPVFSAMFDADMVENETGSVNIPDFEADTVNSLLEYMYTGRVEKLDYEIAARLIVAADKYQVLPLKEKCARFLTTTLSHDNVCEVLVIADLIQHKILKFATINYIKDNADYIFFSEEWDSVIEKNLKLAINTFSQISKLKAANHQKK